ncbi:MAG: hypothetical protein FJ215_04730 [Ignavibacteria bacterium]|nr:hypothetical protein [Ignavibacteria bacterium]
MQSKGTPTSGVKQDLPAFIRRYRHFIATFILVISILFYFREVVFGDKVYLSPDHVGPRSFSTLLEDAKEQGIFVLWNPYIFCGMPSYGSLTTSGERVFDLIGFSIEKTIEILGRLFDTQVGWGIVYYIIMGIGVYLLALRKTGEWIPSVVASVAAVFSMYIIIWLSAGHGTKLIVMAFFPYVFLFVERLRERWNLLDSLALVLTIHIAFIGSHIQMIFYIYFAVGLYLVYFLIRDLITKQTTWKGTLRAAGILVVATGLAFAMISDKYLSVLEYNPYSIRGSGPIVPASPGKESATPQGGLDYDYATNWSYAPGEMMTFVVPSWYGFGWHTYQGTLTNQQPIRVNTYFGPQPFTDAPQYMGVVILFLAVIGFVRNRKDPFVQLSGIVIVISLLIAFGKEFPLIYNLMFDYFPYFNKFRVPSMILVLVQFFVPLLAAYGLASVLADARSTIPPKRMNRWKYALFGLGVVLLLSIIGRSVLSSIYEMFLPLQETAKILGGKYGNPQVGTELAKFVSGAVATDILFAALFLLIIVGALLLYWRKRISLLVAGMIVLAVVVADLWRINMKPVETHSRLEQEQAFAAPDYVRFLQKDTTLFRTLEFENGQPPYSNMLAYWRIQSAFGYQGAKMRWYQDMIDVVGVNNPLLWQLMNVRYILSDREMTHPALGLVMDAPRRKVYLFHSALPRAFFVNRYEVKTGREILQSMAELAFDPRDVTYFLEDPNIDIEPPAPAADVKFLDYGIQHLTMEAIATGNNLLFLSETFYPEGWKAYLDGNEIPVYRANYLFRAIRIPPGKHILEMKFQSTSFRLGQTLSIITNIVLLGGFVFAGVQYARRRRKPE